VKRVVFLMSALSLIVAACGGDGLLDGLGDRAQKAVVGTTTTTEAPDDASSRGGDEGSIFASLVSWYNDGISDQAIGLPAYTIDRVWDRGHESGRFIQSSRAEIAVALPGVQFPAQIPAEVSWVTSQLVYLEDVASLDAGTSAAFGFWDSEPYASEDGRVGVLRVGEDRGDVPLGEVLGEVVTAGLSLIWTDGRYRYELFCRASLPEALCREMVSSVLPLRNLLLPSA
jgi:hypothetical protein